MHFQMIVDPRKLDAASLADAQPLPKFQRDGDLTFAGD